MLIRPGLRRRLGSASRGFFAGGTRFNFALTTVAALLAAGFTNSVATTNPPGTVIGSDGTVQYGAHNLVPNSRDATVASGGTDNGIIDVPKPPGATGAVRSYTLSNSIGARFGAATGGLMTTQSAGVWARVPTGTGTWRIDVGDSVTQSSPFTLTTEWQFISYENATTASAAYRFFDVNNQTGATATVYLCEPRLNYGPVLLPYMETTGTYAYAPRLTCERGATSNWVKDSGDLSTANWVRRGTATAVPSTRSNGVQMSLITVGAGGVNDIFQTNLAAFPASVRCEPALWLERVSTSGTLLMYGSATGANWSIDLSKVADGPQWITRGHPAVTIGFEFLSSASGFSALQFFAAAGSVQAYVAPAQWVGSLPPTAYLRTYATAPLYASGTPTSQNLVTQASSYTPGTGGWVAVAGGSATAQALTLPSVNSRVEANVQLVPGCVYTLKFTISGTGQAGVRLIENGGSFSLLGGSGSIVLTGTPTDYTYRLVATSTAAGMAALQLITDIGSATATVTNLRVYEGTADLAYTPTTGTPVSVYPQVELRRDLTRTNRITNNVMAGAAAGTPGTLPTNWGDGFNSGGTLARSVVATGTALGQPYVDVRISGTSAGAGNYFLVMETGLVAAALTGQAWTNSAWLAIVGGSTANVGQITLSVDEFTSGGAYVTSQLGASLNLTPNLQRGEGRITTAGGATTAFVKPVLSISYSGAVAIDITVRILLPQVEQGAWASAPIITAGAAVTRDADLFRPGAVLTNGPMTVMEQVRPDKGSSGLVQVLMGSGGGWAPFISSVGGIGAFDATNTAASGVTAQDGVPYAIANSWGAGQLAISVNGATAVTASYDGTMVSGAVGVGDDGGGSGQFSGGIGLLYIANQAATTAQLAGLLNGTVAA